MGFTDFETVADLRRGKKNRIPTLPGVYLVLRACASDPEFLAARTGGHFRNGDPSVPMDELAENCLDGARITNIGQATNTLRGGISTVIGFGRGKRVSHRGGRLVWQLGGSNGLLSCRRESQGECTRKIEKELIATFKSLHDGRQPFANLRDG